MFFVWYQQIITVYGCLPYMDAILKLYALLVAQ
jgi:hypothetical protein